MKLRYPKWLKRLVLPFENPEHPLYADSAAIQQREIELERIQNLSNEDIDSEYEEADEELLEDILQAKSSNSKRLRNESKQ